MGDGVAPATRARAGADRVGRLLRRVNRALLAVAGAAIVALTLVVAGNIVLRYGFDRPLPWALDVSRILLAYAFFCALAPALERGAHVAVQIVPERLSPGGRRWLLATASAVTTGYALILLHQWSQLFGDVLVRGRVFTGNVRIPEAWVLLAAPVGALALFLTAGWQLWAQLAGLDQPAGSAAGRG